mmetsp:Transcript_63860/g.147009  ORF Transcript_63860/g.147009 Transcript_63860/m.147009 type:complete len:95 (-) Transcript_63860:52-336(-)
MMSKSYCSMSIFCRGVERGVLQGQDFASGASFFVAVLSTYMAASALAQQWSKNCNRGILPSFVMLRVSACCMEIVSSFGGVVTEPDSRCVRWMR